LEEIPEKLLIWSISLRFQKFASLCSIDQKISVFTGFPHFQLNFQNFQMTFPEIPWQSNWHDNTKGKKGPHH
jgi:hypothetical protein